jgi:DNA-binding response OmpR family regulator
VNKLGTAYKILVVDDDENIRNTMKTILSDKGYIVDLAVNGKEAIRKTDSTAYNVVLLDIRLPDMEGVEILKKMHDTVPKTRKIMLTGFPTQQNAITALNNKADVYFVKPVAVDVLLDKIQEQIKLQEDETKFGEEKIAEFIKTKVKMLQKGNPSQ